MEAQVISRSADREGSGKEYIPLPDIYIGRDTVRVIKTRELGVGLIEEDQQIPDDAELVGTFKVNTRGKKAIMNEMSPLHVRGEIKREICTYRHLVHALYAKSMMEG